MTSTTNRAAFRRSLLTAATLIAIAAPGAAWADGAAVSVEEPAIVSTNGISPQAPAVPNNRDFGVTGLGQMYLRPSQASTGGFVCSGSLINPRTVIFAAHCVNSTPQSNLGFAKGGQALSFGFEDDNRQAVRLWLGLASVTGGTDANPALFQNKTNVARSLYNVEQVWYDTDSLTPPHRGFLQADIAIATLDTPAQDIPTWALLFTPLTEETHGLQIGYGVTSTTNQGGTVGGNAGGVDFRRRAAENMISFLGSLFTRDEFLFGPGEGDPGLKQATYQLDFDSPGTPTTRTSPFDFDVFKGNALASEGITGGGDSGSGLIVDQKYDRKVIAAVLSFGSRYFNAQPASSFGTSSGYQPLFLFWDEIVQNNPYVYASSRSGNRDWTNPSHWLQDMDPNYFVDRGGSLVNALPGQLGQRTSANVTNYGTVCFVEDCLEIDNGIGFNAGTGAGLVVAGGPGSTNFVPNNVVGTQTAVSRYYDVTLKGTGTTTLGSSITIDKLTVDGFSTLDIQAGAPAALVAGGGSLTVLTDFTQLRGWTKVNGSLKTGEALVAGGFFTGGGTFDPTFVTFLNALVSPADINTIGTLTIKGGTILTSATNLLIDINRNEVDVLAITGDTVNDGDISVGGRVTFQQSGRPAVRHNQSFTFITATGDVTGTFSSAAAPSGVLVPFLTYNPHDVSVLFKAESLARQAGGQGPVATAFGTALDNLRTAGFYDNLYGLFGMVDLMSPSQLGATLNSLAPTSIAGEATLLQDNQTKLVLGAISDRLSALGTSATPKGRFSVVGSPDLLLANASGYNVSETSASQLSFASNLSNGRTVGRLPENVSGFLAGGYTTAPGNSLADAGQGRGQAGWHMAMGLEMEVDDHATLGTAFGHAKGRSLLSGQQADVTTDQAAVYGAYRLGGGFYTAGLASVAMSRVDLDRSTATGLEATGLRGTTRTMAFDAKAEAGVDVGIARGLTLTPRASLAYSSYDTDGYREAGGETALLIDEHRLERVEARFGARIAGKMSPALGWSLVPNLQADFVSNLSGDWSGMTVRFADAAGYAFDLPGVARDKAWGEVKGGLQLTNGRLGLGAAVQTAVGRSDYRDDRAVANVTFRF